MGFVFLFVYLIPIFAALYFGFSAIVRFATDPTHDRNRPLQSIALLGLAVVSSLAVFVISVLIFRGQSIYAFSLAYSTFLISTLALWALSILVRRFGTKWSLLSHAMRLGAPFPIVYVFVLLEPLRVCLGVRIHY
jgi:hypothetical protein